MKKFLIALVLVVIGATLMVNAQQSLGQVASGPSVPSGACGNGSLYTVTGTGALYSCNAGSWALVTGGGGSSAFSAITAGTNAHALVMGTGGTLGTSGTGTITATALSPAGTSGNCAQWGTSGAMGDAGAPCGSGGGSAFNAITSGTNTTAAMVVGTGGSLAASGSGTITATAVPFSGVTGTVTATKASPAGTSGNCMQWGASGAFADSSATCGPLSSGSTGGVVYFLPFSGTSTLAGVNFSSGNVKIAVIFLPQPVTFSKITVEVATIDATNSYDFGFYSIPKSGTTANLLADIGAVHLPSNNTQEFSAAQGTVTIPAGTCIFAYTGNSSTAALYFSNGSQFINNITTSATSTGGALPSTITISAGSMSNPAAQAPAFALR